MLFAVAVIAGAVAAAWFKGLVQLPWGAERRVGAAAVDSALLRLDALADSLERAVASYRERAALFAGRRLTCRGLQGSLVAVENGWIAYNARGRAPVPVLDARRQRRDEALYAAVDSVDRDFVGSGCRRP